jgi:hypothetical protein
LEKDLREISVIQQFFTLKLDNLVLYIDSAPISKNIICNCLLLPEFTEDFNKCIVCGDDGSLSIQKATLRIYFMDKIHTNQINFNQIQAFITSDDKFLLKD